MGLVHIFFSFLFLIALKFSSASECKSLRSKSKNLLVASKVSSFYKYSSASSSSTVISDSLFSRTSCFSCEKNNGYITSILVCLYSIPIIQQAFYDEATSILSKFDPNLLRNYEIPKSSVVVAVAMLFAKMRQFRNRIHLDLFFHDAIKNHFDWNVGKFESIAIFWDQFSQIFPPPIKSLFEIQVNKDWIQQIDGSILFSKNETLNIIKIPILNNCNYSIADYVNSGFYDPKAVYKVNYPASVDSESAMILVSPKISILNNPVIVVFKIERTEIDHDLGRLNMNIHPIELNDVLVINQNRYILSGHIELDPFKSHYSADVRDFGNNEFYKYKTSSQPILLKNIKHSSQKNIPKNTQDMLIFYVLESSTGFSHDRAYYDNCKDIPLLIKRQSEAKNCRQKKQKDNNKLESFSIEPDTSLTQFSLCKRKSEAIEEEESNENEDSIEAADIKEAARLEQSLTAVAQTSNEAGLQNLEDTVEFNFENLDSQANISTVPLNGFSDFEFYLIDFDEDLKFDS